MKVNQIARSLVSILGIFLGIPSNAQEPKMNPEMSIEDRERLYAATQVTINGKKTPDLVPYHTRMNRFFFRYGRPDLYSYRKELQKVLSASDDAILFEYANANAALKAREEEEHLAGYLETCAAGESMTPLELAHALEANEQKVQEKRAARFRAVIGQLSAHGQKIVTEFAYQRVRPVVSRPNLVMEATLAPEHFKKKTLSTYEFYRSGKFAELDREERLKQQQLERSQVPQQHNEQSANEQLISGRKLP